MYLCWMNKATELVLTQSTPVLWLQVLEFENATQSFERVPSVPNHPRKNRSPAENFFFMFALNSACGRRIKNEDIFFSLLSLRPGAYTYLRF